MILDVSANGARVQILHGAVPDGALTLIDARTNDIYEAEVIWRRGAYAGLFFKAVAQLKTADTPQSGSSQPSLRVLVVDDDDINRLVLERVLTRLSAQVSLAADGLAAVESFTPGAFDIILMDLSMPVMDGYEAIKLIRHLEAGDKAQRVPIFVVSAHGDEAEITKATSAGADEFITKPINSSLLLETIRQRLPACEMVA